MTQALPVSVNGHGMPATILGQAPSRIPVGGKLRAGIKVLTSSAMQNPQAKAIYEQGVQAGKSFEEIEREITTALPDVKHPLVPKNVPYFTVRRQDFAMPEIADQILQQYGEDRGDGVKRLYRFPGRVPSRSVADGHAACPDVLRGEPDQVLVAVLVRR